MKRTWTASALNRLLVVSAALAIVFMLLPPPAFAQAPDWKDPTALLAWLKLQAMAATFVVTLLWKHVPGLKDISNRAAPWLALVTYIVALLAGQAGTANAADVGVAVAKHLSLWQAIPIAVANSAIGKAIWDGFLKPTLGDWLDRKLGRIPQTP